MSNDKSKTLWQLIRNCDANSSNYNVAWHRWILWTTIKILPPDWRIVLCEAIERYEETCRPTPRSRTQASAMSRDVASRDRSAIRPHLYSISDGIVLALVGLTAITLFLPALVNSRFESRKGACQNNLREIGSLLIEDSMRNGRGKFIPVPMSGKQAFGGVYASTLLDHQMIAVNTTALLCPGIEWRSDLRPWFVPTLELINNSSDAELRRYQQMAGGSYAYNIGYRDSRGRMCGIRNQGRPNFPILADVPSFHLVNRQSANHSGRGQNVFYEDGHITFCARLKQTVEDDPIRNRLGNPEYGLDADDAVLLPSHMPPIVLEAEPAPTVVLEPRSSPDLRSGIGKPSLLVMTVCCPIVGISDPSTRLQQAASPSRARDRIPGYGYGRCFFAACELGRVVSASWRRFGPRRYRQQPEVA